MPSLSTTAADTLRDAIIRDELRTVFDGLTAWASEHHLFAVRDRVLYAKGQYEELKRRELKGTITPDQAQAAFSSLRENLLDMITRLEMGDTSLAAPPDESTARHLLTSLPRLDTRLIGRETEMENLAKALDSGDKVLLVNGMGGVGKTTLAMAYANRFQDQYTHIAWVEQLDDLPTSLLANTVLLKNLDFTPSGDPENDARILLNQLANLGGDSKSLLVIDNATEKLTPFKDDLPHPPHWHVLITSRENLGSFTRTIELDFLTEEKALELFFEHYKLDQDEPAAKEILSLVDRHTLTVELLARTAQERLIQPLARFASQLREQGLKISRKMDLSVLHSRNRKIEKLFPYLLAVFEWTPTSPEAERLLKQFVALPPVFISLDDLAFFTGHSSGQEESRPFYLHLFLG